MSGSADEALTEIVDGGGDADDVLRRVVELVAAQPEVEWAGLAFIERDSLAR